MCIKRNLALQVTEYIRGYITAEGIKCTKVKHKTCMGYKKLYSAIFDRPTLFKINHDVVTQKSI